MPKRRVTGDEERDLLAAAARVDRARAEWDSALATRDQLIAELIETGARLTDIADVLGLSTKAVRDARARVIRAR